MPYSREQMREYMREYMRKKRKAANDGLVKPANEEVTALKARIAQLDAELAAARAARRPVDPPPLPRTVEELKAARAAADEARKIKRAAAKAAAVEKYAAEDEPTLQERLYATERQLAAEKTRTRNLTSKLRALQADLSQKPPRMSKRLHKQVLALLHPDRVISSDPLNKKLERCFQEFSAVNFTFVEDAPEG